MIKTGRMGELAQAIAADDGAAVRRLIEAEPELAREKGPDGVSAILAAVYRRRPQALAALLAAGIEPDLFAAAALGREGRVAELLAADPGAVAARGADGFTALHLAAFFCHEETAALLLARGADANAAAGNPSRVRPLHSAAAARATGIVRLLLEHGADVDGAQEKGYTALHSAALNGDLETIEVLLAHGANRELRSEDGKTAFDYAAEAGKSEAAARLQHPSTPAGAAAAK
jgi:ankyrin repeat protein